jgi:hypothetical protein
MGLKGNLMSFMTVERTDVCESSLSRWTGRCLVTLPSSKCYCGRGQAPGIPANSMDH